MSQTTGTTKIGYVNKTNLADDFRTLLVPKQKPKPNRTVSKYCPICLKEFVIPKSLPCFHTFCVRCLQYAIDKEPPDPDQDRGFMCILCGYFVRVPDYSLPRSEWAQQIQNDFTTHVEDIKDPDVKISSVDCEGQPLDSEGQNNAGNDRDITKDWILEWQLSTYSKSHFSVRGLDPYKRTKKGFPYIRKLPTSDEQEFEETDNDDYVNHDDYYDVTVLNKEAKNKKGSPTEHEQKNSNITAVTQYNENLIVFDKGLSEILVYNSDLTIKSSHTNNKVFGLAVLDNLLYVTNPQDLCIDVFDLETMEARQSINITMKPFGITSLETELAVLLWDVNEKDLHICFVDDCCVTGGYVPLTGGSHEFKNPKNLSGCPSTRLLYVSDSESGLLKCYRPNGTLKWERIIYDAGNITVFNCYVIVARRFTHSVDVLSEGGCFIGRLQSEDYGLISPSVISANTNTKTLVISDHDHMIHVFKIKAKSRDKTPIKQNGGSCSCFIL